MCVCVRVCLCVRLSVRDSLCHGEIALYLLTVTPTRQPRLARTNKHTHTLAQRHIGCTRYLPLAQYRHSDS